MLARRATYDRAMMPANRLLLYLTALAATPVLSGRVVRTAADVATAPVRVVARGVDLTTTSQSEADEKRGRELRRRDERLAKLERQYDHHRHQCMHGFAQSCEASRLDYAEIQDLQQTTPAESR
jgi:hypothetical protein